MKRNIDVLPGESYKYIYIYRERFDSRTSSSLGHLPNFNVPAVTKMLQHGSHTLRRQRVVT